MNCVFDQARRFTGAIMLLIKLFVIKIIAKADENIPLIEDVMILANHNILVLFPVLVVEHHQSNLV